ncbi:MAG: anthranilate synthase component I [Candidatus Omnitrophica bacterium]|nr:anthranilate synthase component I [Candidatus Omnitrophota bacterium]MDD5437168.1 anthranilate synthase component I [Candidatus Omnitrophota bacterium]
MYYPSKKEFTALAKKGNLIPVYTEIMADFETPLSAYAKIDRGEYSFLLESVEGGERIARYSFLGSEPSLVFSNRGNKVTLREGKAVRNTIVMDPINELKKLLKTYRVVSVPGLPRFYGGFVGFLGYDMVRFMEKIPNKNADDLKIPDSVFMMTDTILIFDHVDHKIKVVSNAHITKDPARAYAEAVRKIDRIVKDLKKTALAAKAHAKPKPHAKALNIRSNFARKEFEDVVRKAKEYIRKGDIIQVVPSQRFEVPVSAHPFQIYRALRSINPSPYMYYLKLGGFSLVGSSPEIMVRCEDGKVELRPIAGTRKRGKSEEEDGRLIRDLLADPKERAEHIMLVDLGRNDVGRVCDYKSVKVSELMTIEKYSHVMHIVSDVSGTLARGKDAFDVVRAAFPAGTVTGAPKVRAMEIIDELENRRRKTYAGCVGYFSFSGNLDCCITIRTILIKDKVAYIQAGGGVVADSVPAHEYDETVNKARALVKAIEMAERGIE